MLLRLPRRLLFLLFVFGAGLAAAIGSLAVAQSTLATISGTVLDATGALIPNANVSITRTQDRSTRTVQSGSNGGFIAPNLDPGTYDLRVQAPGFAPQLESGIIVSARQRVALDITLSLAKGTETVTVDASDAGTLNTTDASIAAALSTQDVIDLPANYRGAGSTSPLNVIQTLPGVQPDSGGYPPTPSTHPQPSIKFSIQGGLPSQSETTVDGISAQNQTNNNTQSDAFPSAESISEIRVDGVNNNAEYGQPGEITTVTKSGTNSLHGSVFEYLQNQFLDAIPYGAASKPHKVANDFGGSLGGPVVLPHLYNGRDHMFFFGTYEGLRFPQTTVLQATVPTVLMKQGDFSQETTQLTNPFTGGTYANQRVPVNASSAPFLQFYPDPNVGPAGESLNAAVAARGYNYSSLRRNDISSNQFDARVDRSFGQKGTAFVRYTFKNIGQVQPADLALPNTDSIGQYRILASSFNYAFTPHLLNEFRFGFTLEKDGTTNPFDGSAFTSSTKLNGLDTPAFFNGIPHLGFDTITGIGARLGGTEQSRIFQYVDNVTWVKGTHTLRFGTDLRHLIALTVLSFTTADNYGNFYFHSAQGSSATGQEFADFLLGVPNQTQVDNVNSDNDGTANAYAFYAQDNWKATPNLNFTMGLRYEYHPALRDPGGNIGNFLPNGSKNGTLVYPDGFAGRLAPSELANLNACQTAGVTNPYATNGSVNGAPCTPVLSNSQAGLPAGLRHSPSLRFEPRLGFAYKPLNNERTVLRGGAGYYNITTTGALFYALTGTLQANQQTFTNTYGAGGPAFVFPNTSTASTNSFASGNFTPSYGSVGFYAAVKPNWQDPYSLQTDLSVDHDFGRNIAGRISYVGLHTWHLVWQPELNQLQRSSTVRAADQPRSAFPFPNFYQVASRETDAQSDYRSLQVEFSRRSSKGLTFDTTYTLAKALSDNQGTYGAYSGVSSFVDEQGGYDATDAYNRHEDYGNVIGTRHQRWLSTAIYDLPFGRGRRFGAHMNRALDLLAGGWQSSNILLLQSGPYMSAYIPSGTSDPSGTGSGTLFFRSMRPDRTGNPKAVAQNRNHWFNSNAFSCPGQTGGSATLVGLNGNASPCSVGVTSLPIGRFGTESEGDLTGPGTIVFSSGVSKAFAISERVRLRAQGTFTNILNHTNLADPQLDLTKASFGEITQARGSDFGGNRTGQLALRLEF